MLILLGGATLLAAATGVACFALWGCGRLAGRSWRLRVPLWLSLLSLPLHLLLSMPAGLGYLAAGPMQRTRGDEQAYRGPQLDAQGGWLLQRRGAIVGEPSPFEQRLRAADGVELRAFYVPPSASPARAVVVLAHGLFRGGLELEPPAAMFHEAGCAVLMLELRNHGGSGRAPASFGRDEALDLLAACDWLRGQEDLAERPLLLFGVSFGSAAVSLAAARLDPPAQALVLDSPLDDLRATAERSLAAGPSGNAALAMPQPFRGLTLFWLQRFAGVELASIRPIDALSGLAPLSAALVIAGGRDRRTPPEVARRVFAALPAEAQAKRLWIREDSEHGRVWRDDPAGYRRQLEALLDRLAR